MLIKKIMDNNAQAYVSLVCLYTLVALPYFKMYYSYMYLIEKQHHLFTL